MKLRSSLRWLEFAARKVASQDPSYIPRRMNYALRRAAVDMLFPTDGQRRRAGLRARSLDEPVALCDHFLGREVPKWHFDPANPATGCGSVPEENRRRTVESAEEFVDRTFRFRGRPPIRLTTWDWNPPDLFDRSWVWDLNRHVWFVTLGFAYRYTGKARFAEAFAAAAASWIDDRLPRLGRMPGDTPFEVGIRLNSWTWAFFLFLSSDTWGAVEKGRFLNAIGLQAEYLSHVIEVHSPGNHVLLEAKSLALIGLMFPELAGSARWASKGWRILDRELDAQVCPDGVHAERSTMYHRIIAGELAELWILCRRNGLPQAFRLEPVVRRMAEFESWVTDGRGNLPLFGDSYQDDSAIRFSAPTIVAGVLSDSEECPKSVAVVAKDFTLWVADVQEARAGSGGEEGDGCRVTRQTRFETRRFAKGGYGIVREGAGPRVDVLVWDFGPIGYRRNRKHAHLDLFSFTLTVDGTPVFIDPGTDEDIGRKEWFRSTAAHNTVRVDDREQARLGDRGEIWDSPSPQSLVWADSEECVIMSGEHEGFSSPGASIRHRRTIVCALSDYWLLIDEIVGTGYRTGEARFIVSPGIRVERTAEGARLREGVSSPVVTLVSALLGTDGSGSGRPKLGVERVETQLLCGERVASDAITVKWRGALSSGAATCLGRGDRRIDVTARLTESQAWLVELRSSDWTDLILWNPDHRNAGGTEIGFSTRSRFARIRSPADGGKSRVWTLAAENLREDEPAGLQPAGGTSSDAVWHLVEMTAERAGDLV